MFHVSHVVMFRGYMKKDSIGSVSTFPHLLEVYWIYEWELTSSSQPANTTHFTRHFLVHRLHVASGDGNYYTPG